MSSSHDDLARVTSPSDPKLRWTGQDEADGSVGGGDTSSDTLELPLTASLSFGDSQTSLIDPFLQQQQHEVQSQRLLRRSHRYLDDIHIPSAAMDASEPSVRRGLKSSELTASFPLPPPRTPTSATRSDSAFGKVKGGGSSPGPSIHLGSKHEDTHDRRPYSSQSSAPSYLRSERASQLLSPRAALSVPPPSPVASKRSSTGGVAQTSPNGYWDPTIDISVIRDIEHAASSPISTPAQGHGQSPVSAAQRQSELQTQHQSATFHPNPSYFEHAKIDHGPQRQSFYAQWSSPLSSPHTLSPASPRYPPRAYSPEPRHSSNGPVQQGGAGSSPSPTTPLVADNAAQGRLPLPSSPDTAQDWESYPKILPRDSGARPLSRSDSRATIGTFTSSSPSSLGVTGVLNTLEHEAFDSDFGSPSASAEPSTAGPTRSHSLASHQSSPGHTYELHRPGSVVRAYPRHSRREHAGSDPEVENASRRLARASLVSSSLLRSAGSVDGLKSMLADKAEANDLELEKRSEAQVGSAYRSPRISRPRIGYRHSSGPAPTLASLVDDKEIELDESKDDFDDQGSTRKDDIRSWAEMVQDYRGKFARPHHGRHKSSGGLSSRRASSVLSGFSSTTRGARSSVTHFTVESSAPPLPSLLYREKSMSLRHLAKRADRASHILANEYTPEEIQAYKSERKSRVGKRAVPSMWGGHALEGRTTSVSWMNDNDSRIAASDVASMGHANDEIPVIEPMRRRRSYPANNLEAILVDGKGNNTYHPQRRDGRQQTKEAESLNLYRNVRSSFRDSLDEASSADVPKPVKGFFLKSLSSKKRKRLLIALLALLVLAIVLGVLGGTVFGKRKETQDPCSRICLNGGQMQTANGVCSCACAGSYVGTYCQLDATCQCPDGTSSCDYQLAKALVTSSSDGKTLFAPQVNNTRLASVLGTYLSTTQPTDCAGQATLLDLENVDPSRYPKRSKWFKAVLLWDLATSEDVSSTTLRDAIDSHDYWLWQDQSSFGPEKDYQITTHGFTIDLAYQTVTVPAQSLQAAGLSSVQSSKLDANTSAAFTSLLSESTAASTQRSSALSHFFTELGMSTDDLSQFRTSFQASPVLFPFDVTAQIGSQSTLDVAYAQKAGGQTFPVPLSCQPGLTSAQLDTVNALERDVFGLSEAVMLPSLTSGCNNRPLYGVLDMLQLRTPFPDSSLPGQAAVVTSEDVKRRMTLHSGGLLVGLPYTESLSGSPKGAVFGTYENLDHVIFELLQQLPSSDVAKDLIQFVLSAPTSPPSSDYAALSQGLTSLPLLEVELWGGLGFDDSAYLQSSLASASGTAIFGSSTGSSLRDWRQQSPSNVSKPIRWSLNATSSEYAIDDGGSTTLQGIWDGSQGASATGIYASLRSSGLMST